MILGSFARITESNPEVLKPESIVEDIVMLYNIEPKVLINYLCKAPKAEIRIDKIAFERVLNNIFKNAIQAMDNEGTITIKDEIIEDSYYLSITDSGKGIADNLKEKIFNPNFSTKTSGMGIGLALSKRIIENAKGRISFKSQLGKGATFIVQIPLHIG